MKKNLVIGIIVAVVLVIIAIIAGFFIFSNKDKTLLFPICANFSAWSDCKDGLMTRTNYRGDEKTGLCIPFEQKQDCISCPSALQWSTCDKDNKKTRTNYRYNEATKSCENFSEKADCPKLESRSMLWNWTLTIYPNNGNIVKGVINLKLSPRIENIVNAKKVRFELFKKGKDNALFMDDVKLSASNEAYYTINTTLYENGIYTINAIVYDEKVSLDVADSLINIEN
jgi:hypothetical protein